MIDVTSAAESRLGAMPSCCATAEMTAFWSRRPAVTSCAAGLPPYVVFSALTSADVRGACAAPHISALLIGLGCPAGLQGRLAAAKNAPVAPVGSATGPAASADASVAWVTVL